MESAENEAFNRQQGQFWGIPRRIKKLQFPKRFIYFKGGFFVLHPPSPLFLAIKVGHEYTCKARGLLLLPVVDSLGGLSGWSYFRVWLYIQITIRIFNLFHLQYSEHPMGKYGHAVCDLTLDVLSLHPSKFSGVLFPSIFSLWPKACYFSSPSTWKHFIKSPRKG